MREIGGAKMKKLLLLIVYVALFLLQSGTAPGAMILDTGTNDNNGLYLLYDEQWVAGKFTTNQAWNVGAMEGYIRTINAGNVDVVIYAYNGTGTTPEGSPLISKTFTSQPAGFKGWQGTTGFAGALAAGDYWIAFQVSDDSTFQGAIGDWVSVPNPLSSEAYTSNGVWLLASEYNLDGRPLYLGVRIEESLVPVPGALWLLGSGLVGLVGWRKFRKA
jgi:hypothetical protein